MGADGKRHRVHRSLQVRGARKKDEAFRKLLSLEKELRIRLSSPDTSVADLVESYLAASDGTVRDVTQKHKGVILGAFTNIYNARRADEIGTGDIIDYRSALASRLGPATVNLHLTVISAAFRWAVKRGLLARSPFTGDEKMRVPERTFAPYITPADFESLVLPHEPREHWRLGYSLAIYGGLRLGEAEHIRWQDVDNDARVIRIESHDGWQTKSGRGRVVPVPTVLASRIESWYGASPHGASRHPPPSARVLAHPRARGIDIHSSRMSCAWAECIARARLSAPHLPLITYHGLRHSYATALAMAGVPIPTIQHLLGHASITMTMVYAHVQPAIARDQALAVLDAITPSIM